MTNTEKPIATLDKIGKSRFESFISWVERTGNKLPHPFILFAYFALGVLILSAILSAAGVSVTYVIAEQGQMKEVTVAVKNLLAKQELQTILKDFIKNYVNFAPIGFVLVMMLGVGVAEKSGLISALMRKAVLGVPSYLVTAMLSLVGVCANIASDAGIVFTPAIGGAIFYGLRRNPLAGVAIGYAAALGGFSANIFIAGTDALLSGITTAAAQSFNIPAPTHPLINWYIMIFSTLFIVAAVTLVSEKYLIPRMGEYDFGDDKGFATQTLMQSQLTDLEKKGLRWAGISALLYIAILLLLTVPSNAFFRNESGQLLPSSPLISSVIALLFFFFITVGYAYGKGAGTVKSVNDIPKLMEGSLREIIGFIVVCFSAAMFITWFNQSNISAVLAVKGAEFLKDMNLTGIPLVVSFVILCCFLEIFVTSGSAKWIILAPVFVPMFYMLGIAPATAQIAYRIGDSCTNIISPLTSYIAVIIGLFEKYSGGKKVGIGTVISTMLPYSIAIFLTWTVVLVIWLLLGLPLGPGVSAFID